jgi:ribosomal protein S18 acetylase RimI-like enzyme
MLAVRLMTSADLAAALLLGGRAGWNQTATDWQRFLHLEPTGCFVAEWNGALVGTTTTTVFGSVAWVAMVLVDESYRQRGIGRALVNKALEYLDQRGVATVRLDATPLGLPLYARLGFTEQFQVARYAGTLKSSDEGAKVEPVLVEHLPAVAALDKAGTQTSRLRLLQRLFAEDSDALRCVWQGRRLEGYLASRRGRLAVQLGPCIATPEAGPRLFADACRRHECQCLFVDIPVDNRAAIQWAEASGLTIQRHLTRMCRGTLVGERLQFLWASSGPEKG